MSDQTAQALAQRLVGPRGLAVRQGKRPNARLCIGEFRAIADFHTHGTSTKSWEEAFREAGLFSTDEQ